MVTQISFTTDSELKKKAMERAKIEEISFNNKEINDKAMKLAQLLA